MSPDRGPLPLEVIGLSARLGGRAILDDVSLTLRPGAALVVAGANGSGKSTLLRCLAGLVPFTGRALAGGAPVTATAGRANLGYLPQSVGLDLGATVAETVRYFARLRGCEVDGVLPAPFLPDPASRVGTLSGGQRQRVAIQVAMLGRPPLLLLDEPMANLDGEGREAFLEALARFRGAGTSALVTSPVPSDLDGLADRVAVLEGGRLRILGDGSAEEVPA